MVCGIYLGSPKSLTTDKVYIGQSIDVHSRTRRHDSDMLSGVHSSKMQKAFYEYGPFEWEIIEECLPSDLYTLEKYYIKLFNADTYGFNTYEDSSSAPILCGLYNGNVNKDNIPLYKEILDLTIENPTYSRYKIAELAKTKEHVVAHIWYGVSCKWLAEIFPTEYATVLELTGNRRVGGRSAKDQGIEYPVLLSPQLISYEVGNVRQFALSNSLDKGDLSKLVNRKVPTVKGWIIQDLDILDIAVHTKFYSTKQGSYSKQFDRYIKSRTR